MTSTSANAAAAVTSGVALPWYRTITPQQWHVLLAAKFGWMLDAMDFMLYAMALGQIRTYFDFNDATAGMLGTITLVMSGVGGLMFGYVADRFGRTREVIEQAVAMHDLPRSARELDRMVQVERANVLARVPVAQILEALRSLLGDRETAVAIQVEVREVADARAHLEHRALRDR